MYFFFIISCCTYFQVKLLSFFCSLIKPENTKNTDSVKLLGINLINAVVETQAYSITQVHKLNEFFKDELMKCLLQVCLYFFIFLLMISYSFYSFFSISYFLGLSSDRKDCIREYFDNPLKNFFQYLYVHVHWIEVSNVSLFHLHLTSFERRRKGMCSLESYLSTLTFFPSFSSNFLETFLKFIYIFVFYYSFNTINRPVWNKENWF